MRQLKTKENTAPAKTKSTVLSAPKARAPDGGAILQKRPQQADHAVAEKAGQNMSGKSIQGSEQRTEQTSQESKAAPKLANSMTGTAVRGTVAAQRRFRKIPRTKQQYQTAKTDVQQAKTRYVQARQKAMLSKTSASPEKGSTPKTKGATEFLQFRTRQAGRAAAENVRKNISEKASQSSEQRAEQTNPEGQAAQQLADSMTGTAVGGTVAAQRSFREIPRAKQEYQTAKTDVRQAKTQYVQARQKAVLSKTSAPTEKGSSLKMKDATEFLRCKTRQGSVVARQAQTMAAKKQMRTATKAMRDTAVKEAQKNVRTALVKVIKATAKAIWRGLVFLASLLASSGWALVLLVVVAAAAVLFASPLGILFSGERAEGIPISQLITQINQDQFDRLTQAIQEHSEADSSRIEYVNDSGEPAFTDNWCDVVAVFAIQQNMDLGKDMTALDDTALDSLQDLYFSANEIDTRTETYTEWVEQPPAENNPDEDDEENEETEETAEPELVEVTRTRLIVTITRLYAEDLADQNSLTDDQVDILQGMMREPLYPMLQQLCVVGSSTPAAPGEWGGTFQWPLPGHAEISCHFGEPDAITGAPHRGTDIPAPLGTPVLAAAPGVVVTAGVQESYGNYVVIDHGSGTTTLYAHLSAIAVSQSTSVAAGQTIGLVGSTGTSTGNHLHLEIMEKGQYRGF